MAVGDEYGWVTIWDRALKHRFAMFDALSAGRRTKPPRRSQHSPAHPTAASWPLRAAAPCGLWDTTTTRPLGDGLLTSGGQVGFLTFSRNGATLTVRGDHTPPRTYPVAPDLVAKAVCARAGSGLSGRDWRACIPGFPYQRTC
jgi:hypothetical protein